MIFPRYYRIGCGIGILLLALCSVLLGFVFASWENSLTTLPYALIITCIGCLSAGLIGIGRQALLKYAKDKDALSVAIWASGVSASLLYFHISNNNTYTNDLPGHLRYIRFIADNWLHPLEYRGSQRWHPLGYYYIAALFYKGAQIFGIPELTALRFLSWLATAVFTAFGMRTLKAAELGKPAYYFSCALFVFWPLNIHAASKISNEPLYYAFYAASFYYSVLWYRQGKVFHAALAVIIASCAFCIRNNAVILLAVIAVPLLLGLYKHPLKLQMLWRWELLAVCLACAVIIGLAVAPSLIHKTYDGARHAVAFPIGHFFDFHYVDTLKMPFNNWSKQQSFWDYLLKTILFGDYKNWPMINIARLLYILLVFFICFTFIIWLAAKREEWVNALPCIAGLFIPIIALIIYTSWRNFLFSQDARYIYPAVICFCEWSGRSYALVLKRRYVLPASLASLSLVLWVVFSLWFTAYPRF